MEDDKDLNGLLETLGGDLKDKMMCNMLGNEIGKVALKTMQAAGEEKCENAFKIGNMLLMLAGVSRNAEDIVAVNNFFTEFAAKKITEALDKGDESSDKLLEKITDTIEDKDVRSDFFKLLKGETTVDGIRDNMTRRENAKGTSGENPETK